MRLNLATLDFGDITGFKTVVSVCLNLKKRFQCQECLFLFSDIIFLICLTSSVFVFSELRKWICRLLKGSVKKGDESPGRYSIV